MEVGFVTRFLSATPDAIAPDGSEVRLLAASPRGSMAQFRLAPGCVSIAVVHRSVEEIWCFTAGQGRLWRKLGAHEDVTDVRAGVSIAIPVGAQFQFRNESDTALEAIGVTMPPWPGSDEAMPVNGIWDVVLP